MDTQTIIHGYAERVERISSDLHRIAVDEVLRQEDDDVDDVHRPRALKLQRAASNLFAIVQLLREPD